MKNTRKIISVLLSILMIITSVPLMAVESFAADPVKSGTTGDCTWTLDGTVLTISGNGEMGDYNLRGRVCQDTFCGFSKLNDLSVKKSPKTSCLQMS